VQPLRARSFSFSLHFSTSTRERSSRLLHKWIPRSSLPNIQEISDERASARATLNVCRLARPLARFPETNNGKRMQSRKRLRPRVFLRVCGKGPENARGGPTLPSLSPSITFGYERAVGRQEAERSPGHCSSQKLICSHSEKRNVSRPRRTKGSPLSASLVFPGCRLSGFSAACYLALRRASLPFDPSRRTLFARPASGKLTRR